MYQRQPQQRRTLNGVKSNSAFVNHQAPPPPPPPPQFGHQRPSVSSGSNAPPTHIRGPPRSPVGMYGTPSISTSSSGGSLYGGTGPTVRPMARAPAPGPGPAQSSYSQPQNKNSYSQPQNKSTYSQPQTNHYSELRQKKRSGGVSCFFFFFWTLLLAGGAYAYFNYFLLPGLVQDVTKEEVEHAKHHWMTKYHNLQLAHETLEKSNAEIKETAAVAIAAAEKAQRQGGGGGGNSEQVEALNRELDESRTRMQQEQTWAGEWKQKAVSLEEKDTSVRRNIQDFSRRRLIQKYGYRTIEVELEFSFGDDDSAWITIELAPIDEMPHAVYTFLEQVEMGLYGDGGYAFHHNGKHIIMGAPVFNHLTHTDTDPAQRFADSGIASVLFQEYSDNFPHSAYTVGFAGRPGGPNFYFNTQDNSDLHGPSGYATDGSADPCFGRVIRGTDIIDRMHQMTGSLEQGDWKEMNPYVAVRWIKILD